MFSSLSQADNMCTRSKMDISTLQADQLRYPKTGLCGETEKRVVSPARPCQEIGSREKRAYFRFGQEGNECTVKPLGRNGENALYQGSVFRMAQGSIPDIDVELDWFLTFASRRSADRRFPRLPRKSPQE